MKKLCAACYLFVLLLSWLAFSGSAGASARLPMREGVVWSSCTYMPASTSVISNRAGKIREFPLPNGNSLPAYIAYGPDGNLWFTEIYGNNIGRITPRGKVTEFPLSGDVYPQGITGGPDGNVWFAENASNKIGRITPQGTITEFPIPGGVYPEGITSGPDGNLWFTEDYGKIGRITPQGTITEFVLSGQSNGLEGITPGPDGALWFTESQSKKIGRITTSGSFMEFPLMGAHSEYPTDIAAGRDGNLWFTEYAPCGGLYDSVARITPGGVITQFQVTPYSGPYGITRGPGSSLWFVEAYGDRIGRITS